MKTIKYLVLLFVSTILPIVSYAQEGEVTDAERARILALALAQQVDSTGAENAFNVFFNEKQLKNKLEHFKNFIQTANYKKHDNYASYVQSMRKYIAIGYAEQNDLKNFESWVKKIGEGGYVYTAVVEEGFLALAKTQESAVIRKKIKPYIDRLFRKQSWDKPDASLYQGLLNIYVHTLNGAEELTLLPYLTVLYKKYDSFPLDAGTAILRKDMDYRKLLTYLYAKNLAADKNEVSALDLLYQGMEMDLFTLAQVLEQTEDFKNIPQFEEKVARRVQVGEQQFKANVQRLLQKQTLDGKPLDVINHPVKYIILDFWGSWCMPCRATHPKMRELYAAYRSKGLEIVSISKEISTDLEKAKQSWQKAVHLDKMTWPQLLNNEGEQEFDAVKTFSIGMFPTKILIDGSTFKRIGVFKNEQGSHELNEKIKDLIK